MDAHRDPMQEQGISVARDPARNLLVCGVLPSIVAWGVMFSSLFGRFDLMATALAMVTVGAFIGWWVRGLTGDQVVVNR